MKKEQDEGTLDLQSLETITNKHDFKDLSINSAFFRNKLIQEFNIIEALDIATSSNALRTRYTSKDFMEEEIRQKLLSEAPSTVIWLPTIKRVVPVDGKVKDRRLVRTKRYFLVNPGAWALWITNECKIQTKTAIWYKNFVTLMILWYSLNVGIKAGLQQDYEPNWIWFQVINTTNLCHNSVFIIDILLKWMDDFKKYWISSWNVTDFIVTVLVLLPNIFGLFAGNQPEWLNFLHVFAIIKIVVRFESLRTVVITFVQAMKSMKYLILFILLVAIVYTNLGINIFADYVKAERSDLHYQDFFRSVEESFQSIIILLTLDQWDLTNRNIMRVTDYRITTIFMISWTWLGAFIFRNIFVGVMIHNFRRISTMLEDERKETQKRLKIERMKLKLRNELEAREKLDRKAKVASNMMLQNTKRNQEQFQKIIQVGIEKESEWTNTLRETIDSFGMIDNPDTYWPQDTMFQYLQLMETLMENQQEYEELDLIAKKTLLELHDVL